MPNNKTGIVRENHVANVHVINIHVAWSVRLYEEIIQEL